MKDRVAIWVVSTLFTVAFTVFLRWEHDGFTLSELKTALAHDELPSPAQDHFAVPFGVDLSTRTRFVVRNGRMAVVVLNPSAEPRRVHLDAFTYGTVTYYRRVRRPEGQQIVCGSVQYDVGGQYYFDVVRETHDTRDTKGWTSNIVEPGEELVLDIRHVRKSEDLRYEVFQVVGKEDERFEYSVRDDILLRSWPEKQKRL